MPGTGTGTVAPKAATSWKGDTWRGSPRKGCISRRKRYALPWGPERRYIPAASPESDLPKAMASRYGGDGAPSPSHSTPRVDLNLQRWRGRRRRRSQLFRVINLTFILILNINFKQHKANISLLLFYKSMMFSQDILINSPRHSQSCVRIMVFEPGCYFFTSNGTMAE